MLGEMFSEGTKVFISHNVAFIGKEGPRVL